MQPGDKALGASLISLRNAIWLLTFVMLVAVAVQLSPLLLRVVSRSVKVPSPDTTSPTPSPAPALTVTRESGGSVVTTLGMGLAVNKGSALNREWMTLHDSALPGDIIGTAGVKTAYKSGTGYSSGEYRYETTFTLEAKEPLSAVEVRFLLFDVWGNHTRSLQTTEISDVDKGPKILTAVWSVLSENEVSEYYASIGYVSRLRTQAGRVFEANPVSVVEEAKKFSSKFTAADLEPRAVK